MFTDTEKARIRLVLGYPDGFRFRHTRLESVLDNVSPEAEILVRQCITNLDLVDQQILAAQAQGASGVSRVDEISFFQPMSGGISTGVINGKAAGKFYASRISIILGVPFNANAFGAQGYPGDTFLPGLGGRDIPLG